MDLENKTEMLLIKEKIIESHLQSISEMKGALERKEEEINHKRMEIVEIERKRGIEKTSTEQLHCKVKVSFAVKCCINCLSLMLHSRDFIFDVKML